MPSVKSKPKTIDEYLAGVNADQRAALEKLRRTIRAAAPKAEECMKLDQGKHDAEGKLKNGVFKEYFKDGTLACVGKYRNGEKIGEWKYYLRNGVLRAGGKMTGEWRWHRENGRLMQTGSFVEEKKSGVWKRYHPNGALYDEGEFSDNQKVGEWRTYDARGKLIKTTKHKSK